MSTILTHTASKHSGRMAKKSYTLSPESVEFLEAMRKKRHASSVSSVLEELLQALLREQEKATIDGAVANYYASLAPEEVEEQRNWGEFALREFPKGV